MKLLKIAASMTVALVHLAVCQQLEVLPDLDPSSLKYEVFEDVQDFKPGMLAEIDISVIQKAKAMYFNFLLN